MDKSSIVSKSSDILTEFRRQIAYCIDKNPSNKESLEKKHIKIKDGELYGKEAKNKIKLYNKIITDELIEEIKELQQNTKQVKQLKSKIKNIKKDVRKLCKKENITFSSSSLDKAVQEFDKLCLAVGCKHSFTGACYNN